MATKDAKGDGGTRIAGDLVRRTKISVWVTAAEYRQLSDAAKAAGLPMSSYVRSGALAIARVQAQRAGAGIWEAPEEANETKGRERKAKK